LLALDGSVSWSEGVNDIRAMVQSVNADFDVVDLTSVLAQNSGYMSFIWSSIGLLPIFSLVTASLCLVGFVVMMIDEQRQEFGIFRAVGLAPEAVVRIISWQSLLAVLAGYGAGVSIGVVLTLIFLIPEPVVTSSTILYATALMLVTFLVTFTSSFYPAIRFSRKSIVEIMSR
jgi:putative ABC transport system permease protein